MGDPVRIRRAVPADAEAVAAILHASFGPLRGLYTPAAFAATTPPAAQMAVRFVEGPLWIAESSARPVGTVSGVPRGRDLYVRSMAVVPDAQGHGIGALLLAAVEGFAREAGRERLVLGTTPFLQAAIRLYETAGFRRDAAGPHDLNGTPLMTMSKALVPTRG